ncbi:MAG: hypothetical protein U9N19_04685 [Thermodesulfobacteriota bacterium]|nr:hypothetical protein [Thermodesulfobacteriota bacterium]
MSEKEKTELYNLLESWTTDPHNNKSAFFKLRDNLMEKKDATLTFKSRPSVSYSFRASLDKSGEDKLFVMVDIIDDDPEDRWLSVCFYGDMITDPDETGNLIPQGLLGEDGYCFDIYEYDESTISYVGQRIDEAYAKTLAC